MSGANLTELNSTTELHSNDERAAPGYERELLEYAIRINGAIASLAFGLLFALLLGGITYWLYSKGISDGLSEDDIGHHLVLLSVFLPGFEVSPSGALAGALWGFLIGLAAGQVFYRTWAASLRIELGNNIQLGELLAVPAQNSAIAHSQHLKLTPLSVGLAVGLPAAILLMIATLSLVWQGTAHQSEHAALLAFYLPGYTVSIPGAFLGAAEVLLLALAGAGVFSHLYNRFSAGASLPGVTQYPKDELLSKEQLESKHVVVLGAGPAGLATAHELSAQGVRVTVLERNPYVGGLCNTIKANGYKFDLGGHRWFTKNEDLNRWFRRLMEGEIVMVERISRIYYGGKYFQYPVEIADVMKNAGLLVIAKAGVAFIASTIYQALFQPRIVNMKQAYTAQFGAVLYDMFFRRYTEKVWGKPCDELSSDWVSQRSKGLSIWTVLQEALSRKKTDVTSLIEEFMYPRDGYVRIPERMAEDITLAGNQIRLETDVTAVNYRGANDIEVTIESETGTETVTASDVVSTIPLGLLARITTPTADAETIRLASELEFRDLVTVNLQLRKDQVSIDTWLYVQDEDILFGRLHEPKNWSSAMVPDAEHTSLVLECFCTRGDSIWNLDDDEIAQRCVDDLINKLGFISQSEVEGWHVVRTLNTYPVYDMTYAGKIERIKEFLSDLSGLHIVGRGGTFRYNNADHSIEMGLLLGRKIMGYQVDPLDVNTEPEYQEIVDGEIERNRYQGQATQAQIA